MILKEAYRMQNYLDSLLASAQSFLLNKDNVMSVKEEHLKHKANPADENEIIEVQKETDLDVNQVMSFIMDVISEKEKLTAAIVAAKRNAEIDIDSSLSLNKTKQTAVNVMKILVNLKANETKKTGKGYLIDGEGKQSPYVYDINVTSTIDYDRNKVKSYCKKLSGDSDMISNIADKLLVTLEVDYTPKYEIGDAFEEALALL